jgi:hypothetical protein
MMLGPVMIHTSSAAVFYEAFFRYIDKYIGSNKLTVTFGDSDLDPIGTTGDMNESYKLWKADAKTHIQLDKVIILKLLPTM